MDVDNSHLTSLFENATEGIVLTGGTGRIVLVNPAAVRMFGYEANELIGQPIEILIPDKFKPTHDQHRESFYRKPANRVMGHGRDLFGRRKDGHDIPVEVSLSHYRREDEVFVIAFIVDISRRKEIEKNMLQQQKELERISHEVRRLNADLELKVEERTMILKEALQRLEQSQKELSEALDKEKTLNEIKSRFVSMASHEFRTPLSTVLSSASLLARYTHEDEQDKRNRHIDKIKDSVKHLNDILEDFLSLGKLDEGRVESQSNDFNLHELIQDTSDEIKGLLKKNQQVQLQYSGDAAVCSDKKLLKNVLINLITNAIKFSAEGDTIDIRASTTSDRARIEVEDHGIGISEEDQRHLFTSFYRGANALNIQGTGLGLHIVKRYLDLLGGEVSIRSTLGQGTTITIIFPSHKPTT